MCSKMIVGWRIISSSTIVYGVLRCWYKSLGLGGRDVLVTDDGMENHIIVNHSVWCPKVLVQELGDRW